MGTLKPQVGDTIFYKCIEPFEQPKLIPLKVVSLKGDPDGLWDFVAVDEKINVNFYLDFEDIKRIERKQL